METLVQVPGSDLVGNIMLACQIMAITKIVTSCPHGETLCVQSGKIPAYEDVSALIDSYPGRSDFAHPWTAAIEFLTSMRSKLCGGSQEMGLTKHTIKHYKEVLDG